MIPSAPVIKIVNLNIYSDAISTSSDKSTFQYTWIKNTCANFTIMNLAHSKT